MYENGYRFTGLISDFLKSSSHIHWCFIVFDEMFAFKNWYHCIFTME